MDFTEFQNLTHEIGTALLVLLYTLRLFVLFRRRVERDIASDAKGEIARGVCDAFLTIVLPWKMESTRRHWTRYLEFVVFHIGVFANIGLSFVIAYAPGLLISAVRGAALLLLLAALVAGSLRLNRRSVRPEMRLISSPDDYVSMGMVLLFLATGILTLVGWEPGLVAYFVVAALFLVYEPFSKIRHYIYYPFARFFYGASFGKRGILSNRP